MEYIEGKDLRSLIREKHEICSRGSGRSHSASVRGPGCGAQRRGDSPRPQTAKHHAGWYRPNPCDGFRFGPYAGRRRDDPDGLRRRHHGVHVTGAGSGQGSRPKIRHLRRRSDLVRTADRQNAIPCRERSRQPHQTNPGACRFRLGYRRSDSRRVNRDRQQVPGTQREREVPDGGGHSGGPQYMERQRSRRHPQVRRASL